MITCYLLSYNLGGSYVLGCFHEYGPWIRLCDLFYFFAWIVDREQRNAHKRIRLQFPTPLWQKLETRRAY